MHTPGEWWRNFKRFLLQNQRLLWLLGLFLIGVQIGCTVFRSAWRPLGTTLGGLLNPTVPPTDLNGALHHLVTTAAPHILLLLLLFFFGFCACGAPLSLLVPLFFGTGVGLTEAYHYATGLRGVGYTVLLVIPPTLLTATALLIACAASVRLSALLGRQLLPHASIGGGLWQDVKQYFARFLLCGGLVFAAAVLDTVLRMVFVQYFV